MNSKTMALGLIIPYIFVLLFGFATSDVDQDKAKCANQLVGLATCLAYVSGESNAPPIDCCTGLKLVVQKSPECLCILIKDRNDPSLGLQINVTRALHLPDECKIPGTSISNCPTLLHLAPNSPDAKVFEDFTNSGKKGSARAPSPSARAVGVLPAAGAGGDVAGAVNSLSDLGNIRKRWLWMEMVSVLLFTIVVVHNF